MRRAAGRAAAAVLALCLAGCGGAAQAPPTRALAVPRAAPPGPGGVPAFRHIFVVVMENLGYRAALRLPRVAALARRGAVATRYFAVTHPSLPNYLALTSGHRQVRNDCWFCVVHASNLGAQASAAGVSWGAYMEGLPHACWLGAFWPFGLYVGKHDPFRYYASVRDSAALCAHIQPLRALTAVLPGGAVPRLSWITPNLCNDMHSCPAWIGSRWLAAFVPRILASPAWRRGGVLFVTWDEAAGADQRGCCGRRRGGGHVLTLVFAPGLKPGLRIAEPYNHYSLLATIETALGLRRLGRAAGARTLAAFWSTAPRAG